MVRSRLVVGLRRGLVLVVLGGLSLSCSRVERKTSPSAEGPPGAGQAAATDDRLVPGKRAMATVAGGCFWGLQALFRDIPGVLDTEVGYTGGRVPEPSYSDVKGGRSGHAESVRIYYDPSKLSYETLLVEFFKIHDPTTVDRQGNDKGSQYRSVVFAHDAEQRRIAEQVKARVDSSGAWSAQVVTRIVSAGPFQPAEEYHQDYLEKNPGGYTCHYKRDLSF